MLSTGDSQSRKAPRKTVSNPLISQMRARAQNRRLTYIPFTPSWERSGIKPGLCVLDVVPLRDATATSPLSVFYYCLVL